MALLPSETAIFSPSVARHAASTAKDWAFIDTWLASKYKTRAPPPFERNTQTLHALLALASLNETADENRDWLARLEADALVELKESAAAAAVHDEAEGRATSLHPFKEDFFGALQHTLTKDGSAALDAIAAAAVHLGMALPQSAHLGQAMLDLQTRIFDLEQATARVGLLQQHTESEGARLAALDDDISGDEYRPPPDLARQNLDMQRRVKAMTKQIPELQDKLSSLARAVGVPSPTIQQVKQGEDRYLELLEVKRSLDQQIHEFEGLPPDTEQARKQLDMVRNELCTLTSRRDTVFENLVQRETPRQGR